MHREWITWVHHPHTLWSTTFPSCRLGIDCRGVISWIFWKELFLSLSEVWGFVESWTTPYLCKRLLFSPQADSSRYSQPGLSKPRQYDKRRAHWRGRFPCSLLHSYDSCLSSCNANIPSTNLEISANLCHIQSAPEPLYKVHCMWLFTVGETSLMILGRVELLFPIFLKMQGRRAAPPASAFHKKSVLFRLLEQWNNNIFWENSHLVSGFSLWTGIKRAGSLPLADVVSRVFYLQNSTTNIVSQTAEETTVETICPVRSMW